MFVEEENPILNIVSVRVMRFAFGQTTKPPAVINSSVLSPGVFS